MAPGVILGIVDPGVGTDRRNVAIEVADAGATFVGPDNGLLLAAALSLGPITVAVEIPPPARERPGRTFDGRDVYAPVAARLAAGAPVSDVGVGIDPATLQGEPFQAARPDHTGTVRATVIWVDRFGNAQLDVTPDHLPSLVRLRIRTRDFPVRIVGAYAELGGQEEVGLVVDSYGLLAITINGESAARHLDLRAGDRVEVAPAG
jgi:S-adenosylmethionine hydrolase